VTLLIVLLLLLGVQVAGDVNKVTKDVTKGIDGSGIADKVCGLWFVYTIHSLPTRVHDDTY